MKLPVVHFSTERLRPEREERLRSQYSRPTCTTVAFRLHRYIKKNEQTEIYIYGIPSKILLSENINDSFRWQSSLRMCGSNSFSNCIRFSPTALPNLLWFRQKQYNWRRIVYWLVVWRFNIMHRTETIYTILLKRIPRSLPTSCRTRLYVECILQLNIHYTENI